MRDRAISYFWSGDALRSRSVGDHVLHGQVQIPTPPTRLVADWMRDSADLEPGDVEALSLPRTRTRWPDYRQCLQALSDWTGALGLPPALLAASEVALMACRGAHFHHDAAQYGHAAFCNLFLSEGQGLDVVFPATGQRIPLERGTAMLFDTGQSHALLPRDRQDFQAADFGPARTLHFLTWELPIEDADVVRALGIRFDVDPATAASLQDAQLQVDGAPAALCPASGAWLQTTA